MTVGKDPNDVSPVAVPVGEDPSTPPPLSPTGESMESFLDKLAAKGMSKSTPAALYDYIHSHLVGELPDVADEIDVDHVDDSEADNEPNEEVVFKPVFTRSENIMLYSWITANVIFGGSLVCYLVWPTNLPVVETTLDKVIVPIIITFMVLIECIRISQTLALAFFAARAKDPVPMQPQRGLRVALLTTIVPNKEPFDLVLSTLLKMKEVKYAEEYGGTVDVWLLDEGNDPFVKKVCEEKGINHFSRKGIPEFNQGSGPFKAKTKHGNHNSWRASFEDRYDIVGQADPDHIPYDSFIERTLGYFRDPEVAFVVAPQVYGNLKENWIAHGSAFLAYVFHGIIQRGGNGMQAPLLIGTNHLYRVTTFTLIGGYQDSIIEDHLTAMKIFATKNPATGRYFKGVYTPDIVSVGEGPTSFTDFFNQQKRWAYGIWEIILNNDWEMIGKMKGSQQLSFLLLQSFYPSVCLGWLLSVGTTILLVFTEVQYQSVLVWWLPIWIASLVSGLGFFIWLRRFNLVAHERRDLGLIGMGLMLMTIPIYVDAGLRRLAGRKLAYAVTAKGDMASPDNIWTFTPHLEWASVACAVFIMTSFGEETGASDYAALRVWLCWIMAICLTPVAIHYIWKLQRHLAPETASNGPLDDTSQMDPSGSEEDGATHSVISQISL